MNVENWVRNVRETVASRKGIQVNPHRFGGQEFRWGRVEIGHLHNMGIVDIPFTVKVREKLVQAGLANHHHILPDSGWVTFRIVSQSDVQIALDLLELSLSLKRARRLSDPANDARLEASAAKLGVQI